MKDDAARNRDHRRIDVGYRELTSMRNLIDGMAGGLPKRVGRYLRLRRPDPREAVIAKEIATLERQVERMRAEYVSDYGVPA